MVKATKGPRPGKGELAKAKNGKARNKTNKQNKRKTKSTTTTTTKANMQPTFFFLSFIT